MTKFATLLTLCLLTLFSACQKDTNTQNNTADKTVSGTFDFKVNNFAQPTATPKQITGTFTDLPYSVLN